MSRLSYISLTHLVLLSFIAGMIQCIASFIAGNQVYTLDIFKTWVLVTGMLSIVQSVLLLSYYRSQQYWFAFYTGIAFTISTIVYVMSFSFTAFYVMNGLGIIYGVSLIFPGKLWLRMAGIFLSGIGYKEFAHEGHNIGYKVVATPELWDWMFAQRKHK